MLVTKLEPLAYTIKKNRVFDHLHQVPEVDYVLELLSQYFKIRYYVDYLSLNTVHKEEQQENQDKNLLIGRFGHDGLHEWIMENNYGDDVDPFVVNQWSKMGPNECYVDYYAYICHKKAEHPFFSQYSRHLDLRAEIVGAKKLNALQVKTTNSRNRKAVFDITFKDDANIANFSASTANKFMKELVFFQNVLEPLVDYGVVHGDFSNKREVSDVIAQWRKDFPMLTF